MTLEPWPLTDRPVTSDTLVLYLYLSQVLLLDCLYIHFFHWGHGEFTINSYQDGRSETHKVRYGDDESMPSCTCEDWLTTFYPCRHFFAIMHYNPDNWSWERLSSMYRFSPILTLDNDDHVLINSGLVEEGTFLVISFHDIHFIFGHIRLYFRLHYLGWKGS